MTAEGPQKKISIQKISEGGKSFRYLLFTMLMFLSGFIVCFSVNYFLPPDETLREIIRQTMRPITASFVESFEDKGAQEQQRIEGTINDIVGKGQSVDINEEGRVAPFAPFHLTLTIEEDATPWSESERARYKESLQNVFRKIKLIPSGFRLSMGRFMAISFEKDYKVVGGELTHAEKEVLEKTKEFSPAHRTVVPHISLVKWVSAKQQKAKGLLSQEFPDLFSPDEGAEALPAVEAVSSIEMGEAASASEGPVAGAQGADIWEEMQKEVHALNEAAKSDKTLSFSGRREKLRTAYDAIKKVLPVYGLPIVKDKDKAIDFGTLISDDFNLIFMEKGERLNRRLIKDLYVAISGKEKVTRPFFRNIKALPDQVEKILLRFQENTREGAEARYPESKDVIIYDESEFGQATSLANPEAAEPQIGIAPDLVREDLKPKTQALMSLYDEVINPGNERDLVVFTKDDLNADDRKQFKADVNTLRTFLTKGTGQYEKVLWAYERVSAYKKLFEEKRRARKKDAELRKELLTSSTAKTGAAATSDSDDEVIVDLEALNWE